MRAVGGSPKQLRIITASMARGTSRNGRWVRSPVTATRLPFAWSMPASTQHQVDVFGELLDALDVARRGVWPSRRRASWRLPAPSHEAGSTR